MTDTRKPREFWIEKTPLLEPRIWSEDPKNPRAIHVREVINPISQNSTNILPSSMNQKVGAIDQKVIDRKKQIEEEAKARLHHDGGYYFFKDGANWADANPMIWPCEECALKEVDIEDKDEQIRWLVEALETINKMSLSGCDCLVFSRGALAYFRDGVKGERE